MSDLNPFRAKDPCYRRLGRALPTDPFISPLRALERQVNSLLDPGVIKNIYEGGGPR